MREHLYRGKRLDNGEWIEGSLVTYGQSYMIFDGNIKGTFDQSFVSVVPESIGEHTGLTDKHGRKIFEGMRVKYKDDNGSQEYPHPIEVVETVEFRGGAFYPVCMQPSTNFEIIDQSGEKA